MQPVFLFTPVTEADFAMLHEWMSRPHWIEWWGPPEPLQAVRSRIPPT